MSIKFTIPNVPTQVDYTATSVSNNGATIPVINKPTLSAVATSGAYTDLTGKPTLSAVATSGAYTDLTGKPALAAVATSGKYEDLTGNITATKVTVPAPAFWKYNLAANFALAAATDTTVPLSGWTLSNPTGASGIMNTAGTLTIPATGIYNITFNVYQSSQAICQVKINTSDAAMGYIIWFLNQTAATIIVGQSWTGRLTSGTVLTPTMYSGTANTLVSDSRNLNAITITQLYQCS